MLFLGFGTLKMYVLRILVLIDCSNDVRRGEICGTESRQQCRPGKLLTRTSLTFQKESAAHVSRLFSTISQNKKQTKKYMIFILSDFLSFLKDNAFPLEVRQKLLPGIFSLMDIGTEQEYVQISEVFPNSPKISTTLCDPA